MRLPKTVVTVIRMPGMDDLYAAFNGESALFGARVFGGLANASTFDGVTAADFKAVVDALVARSSTATDATPDEARWLSQRAAGTHPRHGDVGNMLVDVVSTCIFGALAADWFKLA